MTINVTEVECLDGHRLRLTFDNGQRRVADITSLVTFDGVFEPLRDPVSFRQVRVDPDVGAIVRANRAEDCPEILFRAEAC